MVNDGVVSSFRTIARPPVSRCKSFGVKRVQWTVGGATLWIVKFLLLSLESHSVCMLQAECSNSCVEYISYAFPCRLPMKVTARRLYRRKRNFDFMRIRSCDPNAYETATLQQNLRDSWCNGIDLCSFKKALRIRALYIWKTKVDAILC